MIFNDLHLQFIRYSYYSFKIFNIYTANGSVTPLQQGAISHAGAQTGIQANVTGTAGAGAAGGGGGATASGGAAGKGGSWEGSSTWKVGGGRKNSEGNDSGTRIVGKIAEGKDNNDKASMEEITVSAPKMYGTEIHYSSQILESTSKPIAVEIAGLTRNRRR